jgi:hypothetical protein
LNKQDVPGCVQTHPGVFIVTLSNFFLGFCLFFANYYLGFYSFLIDYYLGKNKKPIFATENN